MAKQKKKDKKVKDNNSRLFILLAVAWVLLLVLVIMLCKWYRIWKAWANPDYICIKNVDWACNYNPLNKCESETQGNCCHPWQEDWTRLCKWTKVTSVYYYHRRTSCESWYYNWWKIQDSNWDSWRWTGDNVYWTASCSVIEIDRIEPIWVGVSQ